VRGGGGGEGKQRILIGQSVPPTPIGMAFGRLKLWALSKKTISRLPKLIRLPGIPLTS
jgi:hypothetical protein